MSSREVLHLHIGQAGSQIAQSLWGNYCDEYRLDRQGLYKGNNPTNVSTLFKDEGNQLFSPRALILDLDPTIKESFTQSSVKRLFRDEQFQLGKEDAANNFARGYYNLGREVRDDMMGAIRKQAESCDNLQGFYLFRSLGGGSGSGLGSLLAQELNNEFSTKEKIDFVIQPSSTFNTSVTEPYNAVHSTFTDIGDNGIVVAFDNKALYDVNANKYDIESPTYTDVNKIISRVAQSISLTMSPLAKSNRMTISELKTNLIPFSRIRHTTASYEPIMNSVRSYNKHKNDVVQLTRRLFDQDNSFLSCGNLRDHKFMSACLLYRGDVSQREANVAKNTMLSELEFVDWAPNGIKVNILNRQGQTPSRSSRKSATMLGINTAMMNNLSTLNKHFDMMYQKRAFLHWYLAEGMEEVEFVDAREELLSLEQDYRELQYDETSHNKQNRDTSQNRMDHEY